MNASPPAASSVIMVAMSAPPMKARSPAPVTTTARRALSSCSARAAAVSAAIVSGSRALSFSARSMVSQATRPRGPRSSSLVATRPALMRRPLFQRGERQFLALRDRHAVDVEHHRHQAVVADDADQIDRAALAEPVDRRLEAGVARLSGLEHLMAEVVDDRLVRLHGGGALSVGDGGCDVRGKPGLHGEL